MLAFLATDQGVRDFQLIAGTHAAPDINILLKEVFGDRAAQVSHASPPSEVGAQVPVYLQKAHVGDIYVCKC